MPDQTDQTDQTNKPNPLHTLKALTHKSAVAAKQASKPNFTDRESYLTWRENWRQTYTTLSQTIRNLKDNRKPFSSNLWHENGLAARKLSYSATQMLLYYCSARAEANRQQLRLAAARNRPWPIRAAEYRAQKAKEEKA